MSGDAAMRIQIGVGRQGLLDVGLDWKWWGLAVVAGAPMSMGLMGILQLGPVRIIYYGADPLGVRGVESRHGTRADASGHESTDHAH